jgi:hypothetical protein
MSADQSPPNSGVTGDSLSTALKDRLEATFVDIKDLSGESDLRTYSIRRKSRRTNQLCA